MPCHTTAMASGKWLFKISFPCIGPPPTPKPMPRPKSLAPAHESLKAVLDHLDADKDGKISSTELIDYFTSVGESVSPRVTERVVNEFDSDGDQLLDLGDFVKLMKQEEIHMEDVLRSAFHMFEAHKGCGRITPQGLQQMLRQLGDVKSHDDCVAMIQPFDLDGNGFLDFHEFQQMMSNAS
ncbi:hypothetical protein Fmac_000349 [Flemingia macrophylla]|uniref:EF-hand domain-containing protein n=1 Tax=Flemingia macrophylla TaxID=520843 RepID=A0ABD1NE12_9FABA